MGPPPVIRREQLQSMRERNMARQQQQQQLDTQAQVIMSIVFKENILAKSNVSVSVSSVISRAADDKLMLRFRWCHSTDQ